MSRYTNLKLRHFILPQVTCNPVTRELQLLILYCETPIVPQEIDGLPPEVDDFLLTRKMAASLFLLRKFSNRYNLLGKLLLFFHWKPENHYKILETVLSFLTINKIKYQKSFLEKTTLFTFSAFKNYRPSESKPSMQHLCFHYHKTENI